MITVREPSLAEVRAEIQSLLSSRTFRQSRGLAKLLKYVCTRTLFDDLEPTTEYTIAVDVLGKTQDFKESKDSSVRVEVHRLRKRLAEFYEGEGAGHRIRVVLPAGQYVPRFSVTELAGQEPIAAPDESGPPAIVETELDPLPVPVPEPPPASDPPASEVIVVRPASSRARWLSRPAVAAISGAIILAAAATAAMAWRRDDSLASFWRPVISSSNPILICVGNMEGGQHPRTISSTPDDMTLLDFQNMSSKMMLVADAETMSLFTGLLESKGKPFQVASQSEATYDELQRSPAVLIGLANNDWTERLVGDLRFTLERMGPGQLMLKDRSHPERKDWTVNYYTPYLSFTRDYALVVRVLDPKTEQMVVTAAGITVFGTLAAGEFLTDAQQFKKIEALAPRGWEKKNFELVLTTNVIRGKSGHPEILAAHFW